MLTYGSIQGVLCFNHTLADMHDYIMGEPLSTVTLALLKPGTHFTCFTSTKVQLLTQLLVEKYKY
jgi:hypothetical protein